MSIQAQEDYQDWVGRTQTVDDEMAPAAARGAAALFGRSDLEVATGRVLPALWHWFYFLPMADQARLSEDGHPERGDFMPPVPLPRRMFAGARARFVRPLVLGRPARRVSEIRSVAMKRGRSGDLAFVTVGHTIHQDGAVCVEEERDIVYREAGGAVPAPERAEPHAVDAGVWEEWVEPDPPMLFRFSALTFNAHRIHYDRPYAMQVEGYPGLVVHGPLTAMLLAELVRQHDRRPLAAFSFRGRAPLFDLSPVRLLGRPGGAKVELEARGGDDRRALTAIAELEGSRS